MVRKGVDIAAGNSKVTDYFSRIYSGSQSQPLSNQANRVLPTRATSAGAKISSGPSSSPKKRKIDCKLLNGTSIKCPTRKAKKENAPPLLPPPHCTSQVIKSEPDVISISSSESPTHISISSTSEARTHITISSSSVLSIASSLPEVLEIQHIKQERQCSEIRNETYQCGSHHLNSSNSDSKIKTEAIGGHHESRSVATPSKKRRHHEAITSDDERIDDIEKLEETIYVVSKPTASKVFHSASESQPKSSEKLTSPPMEGKRVAKVLSLPQRRNSVPDEEDSVIPSSQSDENVRELSLLKKQRMNKHDLEESVLAWQRETIAASLCDDSGDEVVIPSESSDTLADDSISTLDVSPDVPFADNDNGAKTPVSICLGFDSLLQNLSLQKSCKSSQDVETVSENQVLPSPLKTSHFSVLVSKKEINSPTAFSTTSSCTKVDNMIHPSAKLPSTCPISDTISDFVSKNAIESASSPRCDISSQNPEPLAQSKTEQIIADIKARAEEKAQMVDDMDKVDFTRDLSPLSESESDSDNLSFLRGGKKTNAADVASSSKICKTAGPSSTTHLPSSLDNPTIDSRDTKNQSNDNASKSLDSLLPLPSPLSTRRLRKPPARTPVILSSFAHLKKSSDSPAKKKEATNDPFASLFAEKRKEEETARLRSLLNLDGNFETSEQINHRSTLMEGDIVLESNFAKKGLDSLFSKTTTNRGRNSRKRMTESNCRSILENTLKSEIPISRKGKEVEHTIGIPLWKCYTEDIMQLDDDVDQMIPSLSLTHTNPLSSILRDLVLLKDVVGIISLMQSGTLVIDDPNLVAWLLEVALCSSGPLADTAFTSLLNITESNLRDGVRLNTLEPVINMCKRFNVEEEFLHFLGQNIAGREFSTAAAPELRNIVLWRFSEICYALGKKRLIDIKLVPDLVFVLHRIGMDVATDIVLGSSIKRAIHVLCLEYCEDSSEQRGDMELLIYSSLLRMVAGLSPVNKEHFLSLIDGDNLVSRRLAQWLAFSMLNEDQGVKLALKQNRAMPELVDILALLKPSVENESQEQSQSTLFAHCRTMNDGSDEDGESESDVDYSVLAHHIMLLSRVLMNIPQYSELDGDEEKDLSILKMIIKELEKIRHKINDRRVTSIDRSLAKAKIELLCMRVDSQKIVRFRKPQETLMTYFAKEQKPMQDS